jgi:hypothetical protein
MLPSKFEEYKLWKQQEPKLYLETTNFKVKVTERGFCFQRNHAASLDDGTPRDFDLVLSENDALKLFLFLEHVLRN